MLGWGRLLGYSFSPAEGSHGWGDPSWVWYMGALTAAVMPLSRCGCVGVGLVQALACGNERWVVALAGEGDINSFLFPFSQHLEHRAKF